MKSVCCLTDTFVGLSAAACSAPLITPTFPDAAAAEPNYNLGMMGSGQSITILEPISLTINIAIAIGA